MDTEYGTVGYAAWLVNFLRLNKQIHCIYHTRAKVRIIYSKAGVLCKLLDTLNKQTVDEPSSLSINTTA